VITLKERAKINIQANMNKKQYHEDQIVELNYQKDQHVNALLRLSDKKAELKEFAIRFK